MAAALQEDVDVIGLSILSGAHVPITTDLFQELKNNQMEDILVLVGGSIPKKDHQKLYDLGVARIFPTSSKFDDITEYIRTTVGDKHA